MKTNIAQKSAALMTGLMALGAAVAALAAAPASQVKPYIIQARSFPVAERQVHRAGGHITRPLPIIGAVAADLTDGQAQALRHIGELQVFEDRAVAVSAAATGATNSPPQLYEMLASAPPTAAEVGATALQAAGTTGAGVTIAMIDTGFTPYLPPFSYDGWTNRIEASVDYVSTNGGSSVTDTYGHGTQITSVAGSSAKDISGRYYGIAPAAHFAIIRAFDGKGNGSYANVISGLNWVLANATKHHIRIVNLSLGATPQSYYWNDPLNQAVMKVWQAGIVVVVAAGNSGPAAQSIDVPGNVPYVITVGAITDHYAPNNSSAWGLASFSATGPTYEGFVKPEVVAPGGHILGTMPNNTFGQTTLTTEIFGNVIDPYILFPLSGTSQAAAVTSGVVALLLQAEPSLTPDQVKCKLMASATPAVTSAGKLAYSVFQQGAGLINALGATSTSATGCANQGLNIAADIAGTTHFGGPANQNASGQFYIMNMASSAPAVAAAGDGYTWSGAAAGTQGYPWSEGYTWSNGYSWSHAYPWTNNPNWTANSVSSQAYTWTRVCNFTSAGAPSPASLTTRTASAPYPAQEE